MKQVDLSKLEQKAAKSSHYGSWIKWCRRGAMAFTFVAAGTLGIAELSTSNNEDPHEALVMLEVSGIPLAGAMGALAVSGWLTVRQERAYKAVDVYIQNSWRLWEDSPEGQTIGSDLAPLEQLLPPTEG